MGYATKIELLYNNITFQQIKIKYIIVSKRAHEIFEIDFRDIFHVKGAKST